MGEADRAESSVINSLRIIVCWVYEVFICPYCPGIDNGCGSCPQAGNWKEVKGYTL
jgi:hypothetical protein